MHSDDLVSAAFLRDIVFFAASKGADVAALCASADLPPGSLSAPDAMIQGSRAEALWRAAVRATKDDDLGLHLGAAAHPSSLGLIAPVLFHSTDFRGAVHKLATYSRLLLSSVAIELELLGRGRGTIRFPLLAHDSYVRRAPRQPMECTLAAVLTIGRQLLGKPLPIFEVRFRHEAPAVTRAHATLFSAPVRFGQEVDEVILEDVVFEWPVLLSDPMLLESHENRVREALQRAVAGKPVTERVRQAIGLLLRGELPSIEQVAARLDTSARSLQRALVDEGTSFRDLLDAVRKDLALEHLRSPDTSLAQVALLLGFSEPSAFHRAWKRWTGMTPRAYRGKASSDRSSPG